jgi:hypothetical protein
VFCKTYQQIQKNNTIILISFIICFTTLVTVIDVEKFLTDIDTNLHYDSNGPKNIPMFHQVMTVQQRQICPIFQPPVETLMTTLHPILHRLVLSQIRHAPWTLHFLGRLPNVSIVCLHPFVLIQPMRQATAKIFDVCTLTSSIRSIYPHDIPCNNIHPNLVPQSAFPFKLEQRKRVSWDGWTLLWDVYISAIYTDEAVVQTATIFPAFKNNLEEIRS